MISEFGQEGDDDSNAAAFLVYLVEVVGTAPTLPVATYPTPFGAQSGSAESMTTVASALILSKAFSVDWAETTTAVNLCAIAPASHSLI